MEFPTTVKGYELTNPEKVRRALEGNPSRTGALVGGIALPDGTYDEDLLLATYDKLGGGIKNANGDTVKNGSFFNFKTKAPHQEPEVMLSFRINGQLVDVPEKEEAPALVKAARIVEKAAKEVVKKKK